MILFWEDFSYVWAAGCVKFQYDPQFPWKLLNYYIILALLSMTGVPSLMNDTLIVMKSMDEEKYVIFYTICRVLTSYKSHSSQTRQCHHVVVLLSVWMSSTIQLPVNEWIDHYIIDRKVYKYCFKAICLILNLSKKLEIKYKRSYKT